MHDDPSCNAAFPSVSLQAWVGLQGARPFCFRFAAFSQIYCFDSWLLVMLRPASVTSSRVPFMTCLSSSIPTIPQQRLSIKTSPITPPTILCNPMSPSPPPNSIPSQKQPHATRLLHKALGPCQLVTMMVHKCLAKFAFLLLCCFVGLGMCWHMAAW
ncbi:hypothetical protein HDV57DRAFT_101255 [Trichoderma longibrachiatum]